MCGLLSSEAAAQLLSEVVAAAGATKAAEAEAVAAEEASTVAAVAATREGEGWRRAMPMKMDVSCQSPAR